MRPTKAAGVLLLAAALASTTAWAFRPSGRWLVDQAMGAQLARNVSTLQVDQELTLYGRPGAPKGLVIDASLVTAAPDGLRYSYEVSEGPYLEVWNKTRSLVRIPGQGEQNKKARPDPFVLFFTTGAPVERKDAADRFAEALERNKVDLDVVTFTRFDGRVNYLVGCKPWEIEEKPSVFFDKDTLLLTRIISFVPTADGKKRRLDVQAGAPPRGATGSPSASSVTKTACSSRRR